MENNIQVFPYNNVKIQKYLLDKKTTGWIRIIIMILLSFVIIGMSVFVNNLPKSFISKLFDITIFILLYAITFIVILIAYYQDNKSYKIFETKYKTNEKIQLYLGTDKLTYPLIDMVRKWGSVDFYRNINYLEIEQIVIWINQTPQYKEIIFIVKQNGQIESITIEQELICGPIENIADFFIEKGFAPIVLFMKQDFSKNYYIYKLNQMIAGEIKFPLSLIKYEFHKKGNTY